MATLKQVLTNGSKDFYRGLFVLLDSEKKKPLRKNETYRAGIDGRYEMIMTEKYAMIYSIEHPKTYCKVMRTNKIIENTDSCFARFPYTKLLKWHAERLMVDYDVDSRVENKQ